MQPGVKLPDRPPLHFQPLGHALEPGAEDRHEARGGFVLQRLLPVFGVICGAGLVEGDAGLVDFVVEVGLEGAGGVVRVPFLGDELHLLGDGFGVRCHAAWLPEGGA